jgi:cytochrome oxidase Cu insertion factor (SCO1/SenC/PrrC family)
MSRVLALSFLTIVVLVNATTVLAQTDTKPKGVGELAPDFTLLDYHGKKITLSDSKGKSPVVLVFYRGYW